MKEFNLNARSAGVGKRSKNLLPGVARAMDARGYKRVSDLYRAFAAAAGEADPAQNHLTAYQRFLSLANGEDSAVIAGADYSQDAYKLACFLETPLEALFGELPEPERGLDNVGPEHLAGEPKHAGYSEPESALIELQRAAVIHAVLRSLRPEECKVLMLRFGLSGEEPRSQAEIAREIGVSPIRISQIEARAMSKAGALLRRQTGYDTFDYNTGRQVRDLDF